VSTATIAQHALGRPEAPTAVAPPTEHDQRSLVGVLFAIHRRVPVRLADGSAGPVFCTCGDVWPCRSEELAASVLDFPL
jgi:hypothetical protein